MGAEASVSVQHLGAGWRGSGGLLHLSKVKVLPAGSSSGSGVEAPAEYFLTTRSGRAGGLTGWGGVAVAGLRRWWRRREVFLKVGRDGRRLRGLLLQRQVPTVHIVQLSVEIPQVAFLDWV